jgi:phosphomannomutase
MYTALHGVGGHDMLRALHNGGFSRVTVVEEQFVPDPDFPTVSFPNPEEPGALDLAFATARRVSADLIIANDPDADRLSLAIPDPASSGGWRQLRGDEVGWLLADHLLAASAASGPRRLVATTIVSSSLLSAMAARHGVRYFETLTGFKWLARNALAHADLEHVLSYEEALGYSVGSLVLDKDGIGAAVVAADLAAALLDEGSSLRHRLQEIEADYGRYDTEQQSIRFDGPTASTDMAELMNRLRADLPTSIAGVAVTSVRDVLAEEPSADVVIFHLGEVGRITVRPSGTEPKCKVYYEVVRRAGAAEVSIDALRVAMTTVLGLG